MIDKLYFTLLNIYKNRFRELTFKDASAFYIPLIIYFLSIIKIYSGNFPSFPQLNIVPYFLIGFSFYFCVFVNNRKDLELLNLIFGKNWSYFIVFLDLLIINSLQIIICIKTNEFNSLISTFTFIFFFTFYKNITRSPFLKSLLLPLNALLITQLRKYKFIYVLIIITYYLAYQGLAESNLNLFIIINIGLILILFDTISKPDQIEYFVFSRMSNKSYIIKNELAFLTDCFKFLVPILLISLFTQPIYSLYSILTLTVIPCVFPLKYINYNQRIILSISSLIICGFCLYVFMEKSFWILLSIIPLSYILHLFAFRKFTKERIQSDSEFYL